RAVQLKKGAKPRRPVACNYLHFCLPLSHTIVRYELHVLIFRPFGAGPYSYPSRSRLNRPAAGNKGLPSWGAFTANHTRKASDMTSLPRLVAFDLDGTLWWPEMYMLDGGAPFRRDKASGAVYDSANQRIELMGDSGAVLAELAGDPKWADTEVAYVSRTEYPEWAVPCLKTFLVAPAEGKSKGDSRGGGGSRSGGRSMYDISSHQEIYPGSKLTHFRAIHQRSGIPYEDMIFFDNERWNITECAKLGITCVYTPRGLTRQEWEKGLADFARARSSSP
ncbi:hypothetical protein Agub_g917, partial [Astrephomene gubernaculifera]